MNQIKFSRLTIIIITLLVISKSAQSDQTTMLLPQPEMNSILEKIRIEHRLPAIAAAAVLDGKIVAEGAVGLRKAGFSVQVTITDQFHLGSCTKSMTAVLIGMMIDEGRLKWTTTLGEIFPEFAASILLSYKNITIRQLLCHAVEFHPK